MIVTIHHNTAAVAMAFLCGKAGMVGSSFDAKDPASPVRGRADEVALVKLRKVPFVRSLTVEESADA